LTNILSFTPHEIPSELLKLQTSNIVHGLAARSTNFQITKPPEVGVVRTTWYIL